MHRYNVVQYFFVKWISYKTMKFPTVSQWILPNERDLWSFIFQWRLIASRLSDQWGINYLDLECMIGSIHHEWLNGYKWLVWATGFRKSDLWYLRLSSILLLVSVITRRSTLSIYDGHFSLYNSGKNTPWLASKGEVSIIVRVCKSDRNVVIAIVVLFALLSHIEPRHTESLELIVTGPCNSFWIPIWDVCAENVK